MKRSVADDVYGDDCATAFTTDALQSAIQPPQPTAFVAAAGGFRQPSASFRFVVESDGRNKFWPR